MENSLNAKLINCEIKLILTWFASCFIVYADVANQGATITKNESKLYLLVAILSTQDNAKLFQQ